MQRSKKHNSEQSNNNSIKPQSRASLTAISWAEITEPGAYVERGSGDLYRIPKEAFMHGASTVIQKESAGESRMYQISKNPFVTTMEARLRCAQHNIEPNF